MPRKRWIAAGLLLALAMGLSWPGMIREAGSAPGDAPGPGVALAETQIPDPVIVVLPFDASADAGLAPYPGFALSPEEVMVVVPAEAVRPQPRLSPFLARPSSVRERDTGRALWISASRIRNRTLEDTGAGLIYRGELSTVIEADLAAARQLMDRGLTLVELELQPLGEINRPGLADAVIDELLARRPLTAERRRFMSGLADSVDTLEMWWAIEELAWDRKAMEYRSRYSCRQELKDYTAPLLADRLEYYLSPYGGQVRIAPCLPNVWSCPELPPENILADLPGKKSGAHYIICAHYDATASREALWDWETDPAPGADDNATGTAILLECARLLAPLELDIGLKFIAFSGEEQGLKGSKCYADSIKLLAGSDSLLGVINIDMVGYVKDRHALLTMAYDYKSRWLSDQLEQAAEIAELETEIEQIDLTGVPMGDHFPFWQIGIPGILFIEKLEGTTPVNPYYHMTDDTQDLLTMSQVGDNAAMVVGFLSRFAPLPGDTLADIELTGGSIEWDWDGRNLGDPPVAGDSIAAVLRALNLGASMQGPEPYEYEIWQGNRDTGRMVHRGNESISLITGEYAEIETRWESDAGAYGDVDYTFVLEPATQDVESDISNNAAVASIEMMARSITFEDLHVFPNPVTVVDDASIAFNIYHPEGDFDGALDIWVYEMLGRRIGYGRLERNPARQEIDVGRNVVGLMDFVDPGEPLPPGIYVIVADLQLLGAASTATDRFKFAVDR